MNRSEQVRLFRDDEVGPGKFRQSKLDPSIYYAHQKTINSVRREIFFQEGVLSGPALLYQCPQCALELDRQFWRRCYQCEFDFGPE